MGKKNIYDIVSNDEYETVIKSGIIGAKAVGDYLGMCDKQVTYCIMTNHWSHLRKEKAVVSGFVKKPVKERKIIFRRDLTGLSADERIELKREYMRDYREKNKDRLNKYMNDRRQKMIDDEISFRKNMYSENNEVKDFVDWYCKKKNITVDDAIYKRAVIDYMEYIKNKAI